jgi:hypothetical protein
MNDANRRQFLFEHNNERQVYEKTTTQDSGILCRVPGPRRSGAEFIRDIRKFQRPFKLIELSRQLHE